MESYEFSRGVAASRAGDSLDKPTSRPFFGMNMTELNFMVNIKVVDNYLSFLMI